MPRFANYISDGMLARGHHVQHWTSKNILAKLPVRSKFVRKWLGYLDQFVLFPFALRKRINETSADHLFVVMDQALGMWVPYIRNRPHVVHCHDLLALRSALGEFPENPTGWTGKKYQQLIRNGFSKGRHFLSVSQSTQIDLHRVFPAASKDSSVVYNGLNNSFAVISPELAVAALGNHLTPSDANGFLMHIGGNQWYKNRSGVIDIYRAWCGLTLNPKPLWMIGSPPNSSLQELASNMPNGGQVRFLSGLSDDQVRAAYNLASLFLFPSLEEGFGWPIAEAMACGAPVLTTGKAPMTEVGGEAVTYHSRMTIENRVEWAREGAAIVEQILNLNDSEKQRRRLMGIEQAKKFSTDSTLDQYEAHYQRILRSYGINT